MNSGAHQGQPEQAQGKPWGLGPASAIGMILECRPLGAPLQRLFSRSFMVYFCLALCSLLRDLNFYIMCSIV